MDATVTRLMQANLLAVFNERDPDKRAHAISQTYTPNVRWTEEDGVSIGHDQLNAKAQQLQDGSMTGLSFAAAGPVHGVGRLGFLAWELRAVDGGTAIVAGFDVALTDGERIAELWTVITSSPS